MNAAKSLVNRISDTARWVAYFRARETERADALFGIPMHSLWPGNAAVRLRTLYPTETSANGYGWPAPTFDSVCVVRDTGRADVVLNLVAGLDALLQYR